MEKLLKDVQEHVMTIENDSGVHRCLHFGRPGSSAYHFRITTWPGHLAITGDVMDLVFTRLPDMFNFFRGEEINPGYWSEKLVSMPAGGIKEFCWNKFSEGVLSHVDDEQEKKAVADELAHADHDLYGAVELSRNWDETALPYIEWCDMGGLFDGVYLSRYLWCLHAIVWGISQYDAHKEAANAKAG